MTSFMVDYLWRQINLKLNQLRYLYVTWPKSGDVSIVRYHVMKVITLEKSGTEPASFLGENPDGSGNLWKSLYGKNPKNGIFEWFRV